MFKSTTVNEKIVIEGNADMFIIPNPATSLSKWICGQLRMDGFKKMAELNNIEFSEEEPLVQIWMVSDDCENVVGHIETTLVDDMLYGIYFDSSEFIPATLAKKFTEGTVDEIVFPVTLFDEFGKRRDQNGTSAELHLKLTASQQKYRYRNFGDWTETLNKVITSGSQM